MDTMRNLNGSLPPSAYSRRPAPREELLQAFKQAALTVTNLYKKASDEQAAHRHAGYQDAVYEVLSFLDSENLGLGDGEGWKVRRWATERVEKGAGHEGLSDEDEDREAEREGNSPIPDDAQAPAESSPARIPSRETSPKMISRSIQTQTEPQVMAVQSKISNFSFRAEHPYPKDVDMQPTEDKPEQKQTEPSTPTSKMTVLPRTSRRHNLNMSRHNRSTTQRPLGSGAGSKRKLAYGDFFGLPDLGSSKEGSSSAPKRHRQG